MAQLRCPCGLGLRYIISMGKNLPILLSNSLRFPLLNSQTPSIIDRSEYDILEAATGWFVISCFITKGLKCHTETIVMG